MKTRYFSSFIVFIFLTTLANYVNAHQSTGISLGLTNGLLHPILGWDHIFAIVAVGLWGALLGKPATWVLPVVFALCMAFGGVLGFIGTPILAVESAISASAIVLGVMVACIIRTPISIAVIFVGALALLYGYVHGTHTPHAANTFAYSVGFIVTTSLLQTAGMGFGLLMRHSAKKIVMQTSGGFITLAAMIFLTGLV